MRHLIRRCLLVTSLICFLSARVCPAKGIPYHSSKHVAVVTKTDREIRCLASAIYQEAGNQTTNGKIAVAFVIFNRAERNNLDLCGVIHQRGQFTWKKQRFDAKSLDLATDMYHNIEEYDDITNGALFFHARYVKRPITWRSYIRTVKIGDHIFYTIPKRLENHSKL